MSLPPSAPGAEAPPTALAEPSQRVRFFASCLSDRFFADAARDGVWLLRHLGLDVVVPSGLACCGQPAWNAGHEAEARRMAGHGAAQLPGADPVVVASGSCAAMMRETWTELLPDGAVPPVFELAEFVVDVLGVSMLGRGLEGMRVAYHHGCHALRHLGVRDQPLTLLAGAGAEVVPWEAAEECCGFGGLFSVKLPWVSAAMADRKLDVLPDVDVLTSADGGCLLQLGGRHGVRAEAAEESGKGMRQDGRDGGDLRVVHLATLLREAVGVAGTEGRA